MIYKKSTLRKCLYIFFSYATRNLYSYINVYKTILYANI